MTGLSYAELSSMFPSAAGEYEYTRHALPEWLAFVVGRTMIIGSRDRGGDGGRKRVRGVR